MNGMSRNLKTGSYSETSLKTRYARKMAAAMATYDEYATLESMGHDDCCHRETARVSQLLRIAGCEHTYKKLIKSQGYCD
jgi:hypothetical protein